MPDWASLEDPKAKPKDRWAALGQPAESEPQYDPLLGIKTTASLPQRVSTPYSPIPRDQSGFDPLTQAPRERDESFYIENALSRLRAVDAMTGQNQAENPAFIRAFVTKDGKLDVEKIDAYLNTVEQAHAATLPAGLALAAKFGHAVEGMTSLGFYHSMGEAEQKTVEENPTAHGPWGTAASAAGTILGAANPVGAVRLLTAGAKAARFGSLAPAVGFGTGVGIEKRDVGAGLEAAVFAGTAGPLGKWLRGANPSVVRRIGSEALASMGAGTAIEAAKGGPIDWSGQAAQAALLSVLSAGRASPIETGRDMEDALAVYERVVSKSEEANAVSQPGAAQLHGDVRAQPAAREGQVPVDEGGAGVRGGGQPEGRSQAQGQEGDRGGGPSGPLRQVGAVAAETGPTGASQRGAISGTEAPDVRSKVGQFFDDMLAKVGRTRRFIQSKILEPAFAKDAASAELIARGAGIPQAGPDLAQRMIDKATSGWTKSDRAKFDFAYSDAQNERQGQSAVGTPAFNKAFPGGQAEYDAFRNGDLYKTAASEARAQFERHVRPVNERAGVAGDISALEGPNGEFSNLIPLSNEEAKAAARGGSRVSLPSGNGLRGPSVPRSINARQRVGGADSYDYSVRNQFARALTRNGDIANRLDIVDSMTRNGTFVKAEEGVERPEGYVQVSLDLGKGLKAGAENEVGGHVVGWVAPEFVSPLRARFRQGFASEEAGAGSAAKQAGVFTQLFVNPAVGVGHVALNIAPRVAWNALTSPLKAGMGAVKFIPRAVHYMLSPSAHAQARLQLTDDTGQSRDAHQKSTVPYIGRASDVAGRIIDSFDTAGRQAVNEFVKAKQASGAAAPGFQTRHEAQLKMGQYSALLQDTTTKAWKAWLNPFTVIGKAAVDNVFSTFPGLSQGFQAADGKARVGQAARVAAVVGAYTAYKALVNYQKTAKDNDGNGSFFPPGMPTNATYDGIDPKTGAPLWHWSMLDNLLMIPRIMSWTPAAGIDPLREGRPAAAVGAALVGGPMKAATHVMNYWPRVVEKIGQEASGADMDKLRKEFPALDDVLDLLGGQSLTDTFLPQTGLHVGKTDKQLWEAAHPNEAKKAAMEEKARALKDAREKVAGR